VLALLFVFFLLWKTVITEGYETVFELFEGFAIVLDLDLKAGLAGFGDLGFEVFDGLYFGLVLFLELGDFLLEFMEADFCVFQVLGFVGIGVGSEEMVEFVSAG
jgi:hypothetical protein